MDIEQALPLLGGLSPQAFMQKHWHKKPLLIRQAIGGMAPMLTRAELFDLAGREEVESRLISSRRERGRTQWQMRRGPIQRRSLPTLKTPNWTLLVQGLDLHLEAARAMLNRFRFVPDARLDDLMVSFATEGGGVGPHYDSYDVFLLQAQGRRRWRIARRFDPALRSDVPLKILANFQAEQEFVLEAGDMLYLPPHYAHDGIAEQGECMTYSIGFRSPARAELAQELLQRLADQAGEGLDEQRYRDPAQAATSAAALIPAALEEFARQSVMAALKDPHALAQALGELLSEPKPQVWFEPGRLLSGRRGVVLDRRTRMLFDDRHVYINGESFLAAGQDAQLMRHLANERCLATQEVARLSKEALGLLKVWCASGWLHPNK
ncbi:MAG: JmjC domain-containing protein [Hylemonella sp.]